jgi:hypothetical protein
MTPPIVSREERFAKMRERQAKLNAPVPLEVSTTTQQAEKRLNLAGAARELGVSYSTARRLLRHESGVMRYSTTTAGTQAIFPDTLLKRNQKVRMTYVIPESVIVRLRCRMRGQQAA